MGRLDPVNCLLDLYLYTNLMEYLLKFFAIFFTCLFKFVAGPILGTAAGFGLFEIVFVTLSGMMVSVLFVTYLGNWFKSHWTLSVNKKGFLENSFGI